MEQDLERVDSGSRMAKLARIAAAQGAALPPNNDSSWWPNEHFVSANARSKPRTAKYYATRTFSPGVSCMNLRVTSSEDGLFEGRAPSSPLSGLSSPGGSRRLRTAGSTGVKNGSVIPSWKVAGIPSGFEGPRPHGGFLEDNTARVSCPSH